METGVLSNVSWRLPRDCMAIADHESEQDDSLAISQFAWIPSALLTSLMHRDVTPDTRSQTTSTFKSLILPLPTVDAIDEQVWVDRLLLVCIHLDDGGMKALERLSGLKGFRQGNLPYKAYVQTCEENNVSPPREVPSRRWTVS